MENLLIPALAAGFVFVVFLFIIAKFFASEESQRKKKLINMISQDVDGFSTSIADKNEDVQLIKDDSVGGLLRIPFIKYNYDLLNKAGVWEKRVVLLAVTLIIFLIIVTFLKKLFPFNFLIGALIAYILAFKYVTGQIEKHTRKFLDLFPDAIDMITRSVKSGYPLNTAMRMIADNMQSPVKEEFRKVIDEVSYGRTLPEALKRMANRIPAPDVNFFVVALSIQQETGGSLTEVLSNLSNLIRKRKQLRAKINAMTTEGKTTSYILGAIPIVEFSALYYISPNYLEPLFSMHGGGLFYLGAAVTLIIASQVIVRMMINIDI
ncbi:MAG: type II secretion system F family protein [Pseudomonadota bacterium]